MRTAILSVLVPACLAAPHLACRANGPDFSPPSLSPNSGPVRGGTRVQIRAADLVAHGVPAVFFGSKAAKGVILYGPRLLEVTAPAAQEPGEVRVRIDYVDGTRVDPRVPYTYTRETAIVVRPSGQCGPLREGGSC